MGLFDRQHSQDDDLETEIYELAEELVLEVEQSLVEDWLE